VIPLPTAERFSAMKHYGMAGWRVKQNYCPLTLLISSKAAMLVVPSKLRLLANCRRILL
jgi:hypothetical protein